MQEQGTVSCFGVAVAFSSGCKVGVLKDVVCVLWLDVGYSWQSSVPYLHLCVWFWLGFCFVFFLGADYLESNEIQRNYYSKHREYVKFSCVVCFW